MIAGLERPCICCLLCLLCLHFFLDVFNLVSITTSLLSLFSTYVNKTSTMRVNMEEWGRSTG